MLGELGAEQVPERTGVVAHAVLVAWADGHVAQAHDGELAPSGGALGQRRPQVGGRRAAHGGEQGERSESLHRDRETGGEASLFVFGRRRSLVGTAGGRRESLLPRPRPDMETAPRLDHADDAASASDVSGRKTALVTGSNGGVGLALAEKLAADGWRVLLHGRDAGKLAHARARLEADPDDALRADLAEQGAVRQLAADVRERTDRLDALVHNAGLLRPALERTAAGVETTMAVNALAPFVLTNELRPLLEATARDHGGARVVTVSSEAHNGGRILTVEPVALAEALGGIRGGYSSLKAYCQSKLVATAWTLELARRLEGAGVTANACHPGVVRTGVFGGMGGVVGALAGAFSFLYLSPKAGAESPYLLTTGPAYATRTGRWVTRGHLRGPHEADPPKQAQDPAVGGAVWDALGRLADA